MSTSVYIDNRRVCELPALCAVQEIYDTLHVQFVSTQNDLPLPTAIQYLCNHLLGQGLDADAFYLHQHGRIADRRGHLTDAHSDVHVALRLRGGKGGFGSMLRAIGAQIEKTTNREACRDLSGRRLRDINEEKRMKSWLDGQKDRDAEVEERRKKRLEKAQAQPKHVFEDKAYEHARAELTQNVADAVEEGFRKAAEVAAERAAAVEATKKAAEEGGASGSGVKRKAGNKKATKAMKKKKKSALW